MLILNDFFNNFTKGERLTLVEMLTNKDKKMTLVIVSNDPLIMAACDQVLFLEKGKVKAQGAFEDMIKQEDILKDIY